MHEMQKFKVTVEVYFEINQTIMHKTTYFYCSAFLNLYLVLTN